MILWSTHPALLVLAIVWDVFAAPMAFIVVAMVFCCLLWPALPIVTRSLFRVTHI